MVVSGFAKHAVAPTTLDAEYTGKVPQDHVDVRTGIWVRLLGFDRHVTSSFDRANVTEFSEVLFSIPLLAIIGVKLRVSNTFPNAGHLRNILKSSTERRTH